MSAHPPAPPSLDQLKLPPGWELKYTKKGTPFFLDHINKLTRWDPPPGTVTASQGDDTENPLARIATAALLTTEEGVSSTAEGVVILDGDLLVQEVIDPAEKKKSRKKRTLTYHLKKKASKLMAAQQPTKKPMGKDDLASFTKRYVVMQRLHITIFESRTERTRPIDTIPLSAVKDVEYGDGTRFDLVFAGGDESSFHAPNSDVAQAWVESIEDRVLDLAVVDGQDWKAAHEAAKKAEAEQNAAEKAAAAEAERAANAKAAAARGARLAQLTKTSSSTKMAGTDGSAKVFSRVQRAAEARRAMQLKRQQRLDAEAAAAAAAESESAVVAAAPAGDSAATAPAETRAGARDSTRSKSAALMASSTDEERAIEAAYAIEVAVEEAVKSANEGNSVMSLPAFVGMNQRQKTAALRHVFNEADANDDGFLTPSEFVRSLRKGAGARLADSLFAQMKLFQTIDTEGMGTLSFDDFVLGLGENKDPAILLWINVSISVMQLGVDDLDGQVLTDIETGKVSPWEGWDRHVDPDSRASYYVDAKSGATKWGDELRALQAEHAAGGGLESFAEEEYEEEEYEEYEALAAAALGAVGAGLERHVDPTSRASYYFDPASGVTQWGDELRAMRADFTGMALDDFAEGDEEEEEYDDAAEAADGGEEQPTLLTDPTSGYQYYYDRASGETRWVDES